MITTDLVAEIKNIHAVPPGGTSSSTYYQVKNI